MPYVCGITRCVTLCVDGYGRFIFDPAQSPPVPGHQIPPGSPVFEITDPGLHGIPDCCTDVPCVGGTQDSCAAAPLIGEGADDPDCYPIALRGRICCCDLERFPDGGAAVRGRIRIQTFEAIQSIVNYDGNGAIIPFLTGTHRIYKGFEHISSHPDPIFDQCASYEMLWDRTGFDESWVGRRLFPDFNFGCRVCAQWPWRAPRRVDVFSGGEGFTWGESCHGYNTGSQVLEVLTWTGNDPASWSCTSMVQRAVYRYTLFGGGGPGGVQNQITTSFFWRASIVGGSDSCGNCSGRIGTAIPGVPGSPPGGLPGAPPINVPLGAPCQGCGQGQHRVVI